MFIQLTNITKSKYTYTHILLQTQFTYPTCTWADQDQNLHKNCLCRPRIIGQDDILIQLPGTCLAHNIVLTNVYLYRKHI
jgi:hypothetical protein